MLFCFDLTFLYLRFEKRERPAQPGSGGRSVIANSENLKDIIIVVLWPVSTILGTYPTPTQIKTQFDVVAVDGLEPPTLQRIVLAKCALTVTLGK